MTQSNPDFEVAAVALPPQPPPENETTEVLQFMTQVWSWPAVIEFDSWQEALNWSTKQHMDKGPKYLVRKKAGTWEAIQAWMRSL